MPAERIAGLISQQPRGGRIPGGYDLSAVHRHDRDRADLDERLEVLLLAADLGARQRLLGGGGWGEQSRVVERDAHVRRQRRQEALVVGAVRVLLARPDGQDPMRSPVGIGTPRYDSVRSTLNGAPMAAASSALSDPDRPPRRDDPRGQDVIEDPSLQLGLLHAVVEPVQEPGPCRSPDRASRSTTRRRSSACAARSPTAAMIDSKSAAGPGPRPPR